MASAKLKMDLNLGVIEAEGDESFVLKVYQDFKAHIENAENFSTAAPKAAPAPPQPSVSTPTKKPAKKKPAATNGEAKSKKKPRGSYGIVSDLDLSNTQAGRLKDFYNTFSVKTNYERNLIFIYFMQHKMGLTGITEDHVFTCYRDIPGIKVPKALHQSLIDTASDQGWIDTSDFDNLKVPVHGMNHLEHDLAKATAS